MCELQWDALAEIYLKKPESNREVICLCTRVFIRNKNILTQNISIEQSASEDDIQNEEDISNTSDTLPNLQRSTSVKNENDHETVSCYCSASHTDNFSTDEHDSLRDTHEVTLIKGIQQSDSGADLTEYLKHDIESDWNKFWSVNGEKLIWQSWIEKYSAYINPDYLQHDQDATKENEGVILTGTTDDNSVKSKHSSRAEKFLFDEKEVQNYNTELLSKELRHEDRPSCSQRRDNDLRNRILVRNLSGSDERLFTEVSEGWNPLSPLSIDCETEVERLLSSQCGSHASSSLRTVDSMTNVTRMTVSSLELSNSTSSSDSFSSVSSVNSSLSSEESEEDYQSQWNILWKRHYEEEYLQQYNKFIESMIEDSLEKTNNQTGKSALPKKTTSAPNSLSKVTHTLGGMLINLSIPDDKSDIFQEDCSEADCEQNENVQIELEDMIALGLPTCFGTQKFKKAPGDNCETFKSLLGKSNSFESSRSRIKAAFNLLGIEFRESSNQAMSGEVNYKMKHIRLQNRHLKMRPDPNKKPKHTYFDDDGNALPEPEHSEEMTFHNVLSDSSDNKLSSCDEEILPNEAVTSPKSEDRSEETPVPKRKKRKKKPSFPPEIKENARLRKYWHRRFSLFSKFDRGIKLDEESWYSVTPEQVAKHAAERCRCNVIVDAFCGAGGNAIQFALTCNQVIAIDIDPKKIELAQNNAKVYGVADKIQFIVGDFFQLADSLKADKVFLSPPWGGPTYLNQPMYELEEMLQPVPLSQLLAAARKISLNLAVFLPKNSNTYALVHEAGVGGRVEIEQDFLNKKLVAVTAYYNDLIKEK
ncbi:uncharacterized protein LOC108907402 isoform X2 [Anoplophora glabripennis]|uniref:uncharacterized protein LOC108907402 isoform X2 n=1 Tax=Anoplophora glabripennis TaxID=217634 RepID=UPI000875644B|nr:uncharacterized protein LOC108907402 isoform X2 [Anoplophora glabripennis]